MSKLFSDEKRTPERRAHKNKVEFLKIAIWNKIIKDE